MNQPVAPSVDAPASPARLPLLARAAYFGIPILLLIIVHWRGLGAWFMMDDFAWLGLPLEVHHFSDLVDVLFRPAAQGTVRFLSERAFFLTLASTFGITVLPFKIVVAATASASLVLLSVITRRITGSMLAGFAAPVLYLFNSGLVTPLSWPSAFNEVLLTCLVLSSFYLFLRYIETGATRYYIAQWITFLLGFGALELNVLYPALIALYTLCCARKYFPKTLPIFVASAAYTAINFLFIPKSHDPIYQMYFDRAMVTTFAKYVAWTLGPARLAGLVNPAHRYWGYSATAVIAIAVLGFGATRILKRDLRAVFCIGWFLIVIAPLVPLKNHITDYYPVVPMIGLSILAAWAIDSAFTTSKLMAAVACALVLVYAVGHYRQSRVIENWRYEQSHRFENALHGIAAVYKQNPRSMVLVDNVDSDLYAVGFYNDAFRLFGIPKVYLVPGSEIGLEHPQPMRGLDQFKISPGSAAAAAKAHQLLAVALTDQGPVDVTSPYEEIVRNLPAPGEPRMVDVGQNWAASQLGPVWYPIEGQFRWMSDHATVRMGGPENPSQKLHIQGFCPAAVVANGPIHMIISAGNTPLGRETLTKGDPFTFEYALPPKFVGQPAVEIEVEVDKVLTSPGETRRLGIIFGTFEIR